MRWPALNPAQHHTCPQQKTAGKSAGKRASRAAARQRTSVHLLVGLIIHSDTAPVAHTSLPFRAGSPSFDISLPKTEPQLPAVLFASDGTQRKQKKTGCVIRVMSQTPTPPTTISSKENPRPHTCTMFAACKPKSHLSPTANPVSPHRFA